MALFESLLGFAGGLFGQSSREKAAEKAASRQEAVSREFAQHGVRWRVEDAKAAGIHPLAALGASTHTAPGLPVPASGDAVGAGLSSLGKAIDEASAERPALENDLLRAQIRKTDAETMRDQAESRTRIANGRRAGQVLTTPPPPEHSGLMRPRGTETNFPGWSDAQKYEDRYGEMSDFIYGPRIFIDDQLWSRRNEDGFIGRAARRHLNLRDPGYNRGPR